MHWMTPKKESMIQHTEDASIRTEPHTSQTDGHTGEHSSSQSAHIPYSQLNNEHTGSCNCFYVLLIPTFKYAQLANA